MENLDTKSPSWYTVDKHMETFLPSASNRQTETAIKSLAVIGFIALVVAGLWLAVYSTRFVPAVVNGVGEAAVAASNIVINGIEGVTVYLDSLLTPAPESVLSVVPTSTIIYFGQASTTEATATTTVNKPVATVKPTAGAKTSGTYEIGGQSGHSTATSTLFGLSDLIVNINAVGYLTSTSTNSFVASSTVPSGSRPAVRFTIKNIGTNITGPWRFSASIPTQTVYIYQSQQQQSLSPNDSIEYTLGFDQANKGVDKLISITANFDHIVAESNTNNNSDSIKVTILGS
jgi:hypothetical protein